MLCEIHASINPLLLFLFFLDPFSVAYFIIHVKHVVAVAYAQLDPVEKDQPPPTGG